MESPRLRQTVSSVFPVGRSADWFHLCGAKQIASLPVFTMTYIPIYEVGHSRTISGAMTILWLRVRVLKFEFLSVVARPFGITIDPLEL